MESDCDTDSDVDFEIKDSGKDDDISVRLYLAACRKYKVVVSSKTVQQLTGNVISIHNHGLEDRGVLPLSIALLSNVTVTSLRLPCNSIGGTGTRYLADVLANNRFIVTLDLADNCIHGAGIKALSYSLKSNTTLTSLNISGCGLVDADAKHVAEFLKVNRTLRELNLSHNALSEDGGSHLSKALEENITLQKLDLSWNHLRLKGANAISEGVKENYGLKVLNLSWNGFANDGAYSMGVALKRNHSLEELDLSCNRINMEGAGFLCNGLGKNSTLRVLKLSKNPVTTVGACLFLELLRRSTICELKQLELFDIEVEPKFEMLLEEVLKVRQIQIHHGGHVRSHDPYATRLPAKGKIVLGDPLTMLMTYIKENNLRLMDLFTQFDKDNNWSVSRDEFRKGMQMVNLPLTEEQIDQLMDKLDKDKNGEIDFGELIMSQKEFRIRERRRNQRPITPYIGNVTQSRDGGTVTSSTSRNTLSSGTPVERPHSPSPWLRMTGPLGEESYVVHTLSEDVDCTQGLPPEVSIQRSATTMTHRDTPAISIDVTPPIDKADLLIQRSFTK